MTRERNSRALALPQNEIFRKYVSEDFPDLRELAKHAPLVMTNTHEFYDFQRPTLAKVINLGGLGLGNHKAAPLPAVDGAIYRFQFD